MSKRPTQEVMSGKNQPKTFKPAESDSTQGNKSQHEVWLHAAIAAAIKGDLATIQKLVRTPTEANVRNPSGATLLMIAAYHGHLSVVEHLLQSGADVHATFVGRDGRMNNCLAAATYLYNFPVLQRLILAWPNPTPKDLAGALHSASFKQYKDIQAYLLEKGADPKNLC